MRGISSFIVKSSGSDKTSVLSNNLIISSQWESHKALLAKDLIIGNSSFYELILTLNN